MRLVFFLLGFSVALATGDELQTLAQVRAIPGKKAEKGQPVLAEGVVIVAGLGRGDIIIHDGTAGCHVANKSDQGDPRVRPGSRVRVSGITRNNSFFPDIIDAEITWISDEKLPEPRKISPSDIYFPGVDSEWVEVEAVLVGKETKGLACTLAIEVGGQPFKADVFNVTDAELLSSQLMQKRVRMQAIIGTVYNEKRQLTARHFFVPSLDHIIPIERENASPITGIRPIETLLRRFHRIDDLTKLKGTITSSRMGGFYLRDATGSVFVRHTDSEVHSPGSEVEVDGFAAVSPFSPTFRATRIRRVGTSELPSPALFRPESEKIWLPLHNELVRVSCEYLYQRDGLSETILQCRAGEVFFEAWVPKGSLTFTLAPGDLVSLKGILECTTTRSIPRHEWVDGFRLHLSDAQAITITRKTPWWNPDRILIALGIATTIILIGLLWNFLLRRQVARQASIIRRQAEIGVVQDERQRIARELHDTLEQELTGLSLQLGNVSSAIRENESPARQSLTLAQQMLQHCRHEARASVIDLRDPNLLERNLAEALRVSLDHQLSGSKVMLNFSSQGPSRPLPATTQNHLLRIAREAVSNALRHGQASGIRCQLGYTEEGVSIEIEDNGCGFDASKPSPVGHFGLIGMQERANKIQAKFTLTSNPGSGTTVCVYLPYSSP